MPNADERLRILKLIEDGQVNAEEGAQLIDALGESRERSRPTPSRTLRVRVTNLATRRQTINVTIPVSLVEVGLKLGARLAPRVANANPNDILRALESGATGRIFELQDLNENERIEIFVE
ncbi:hypothetical protein SE17_12990 [Kouleothrix aurantiaca]|jgi:hypothetical protein|uniref:YvlB/LiaX N-terminal domain-containing protein n=1 Tax=Kouleothrix aurantiaca TaxID=186479 RepID=A0A0P9D1Q4_9CHLR|nr:hypothetical protein SE17_12990 [Kouleothrix aurantiaca]